MGTFMTSGHVVVVVVVVVDALERLPLGHDLEPRLQLRGRGHGRRRHRLADGTVA